MTAPLWTADEVAAVTGGRALADFTAHGVSVDARSLQAGDLFVALPDAQGGHDAVARALEEGAAGALVARRPEGLAADAPLVLVPDVLQALTALGRAARARTQARVIAVTGPVGKTSSMEMLGVMLGGQGGVQAAEAGDETGDETGDSAGTETGTGGAAAWGLPLALARVPRDADFAVVEIGLGQPGGGAALSRLARPHAVLVTARAAAHAQAGADGIDESAREIAALVAGLGPQGAAVLPADLPLAPALTAAAGGAGARIVTFGTAETADLRLRDIALKGDATVVRAFAGDAPLLFKVHGAGRHFAVNALGALGVVMALGLDLPLAALDLGRWTPPAGRGLRETIVLDVVQDGMSIDLIDDAFNSSPASMSAALDMLGAAEPVDDIGRVAQGRRIAILGDMPDLGPEELALHAAIADHPMMPRLHAVHCVGPAMRALWQALPPRQRGEWHEDAAGLAARAHHLVDAGDVVLVKHSQRGKVGLVVDALRKLGQAGAAQTRRTD